MINCALIAIIAGTNNHIVHFPGGGNYIATSWAGRAPLIILEEIWGCCSYSVTVFINDFTFIWLTFLRYCRSSLFFLSDIDDYATLRGYADNNCGNNSSIEWWYGWYIFTTNIMTLSKMFPFYYYYYDHHYLRCFWLWLMLLLALWRSLFIIWYSILSLLMFFLPLLPLNYLLSQ